MAKINPFGKLRTSPSTSGTSNVPSLRIKAVFFDMAGVMVPSSVDDISRAVERFFNIKNFHFLNSPFARDLFRQTEIGKITERKFWQEFSKKVDRPLRPGWEKIIPDSLKNAKIRPKMKRLVFYLKEKGTKTAILSNVSEPFARRHYRLGHYQIFDHLILSHKVGFRKPDVRIYLHALSLVKAQPHESVFIDDKEENIKVANQLGMKGIVYENTNQIWRWLEKILI